MASSSNPVVVVSDDPGEAVETPAGSNAFVGNYRYNNANTDGIAVSGISGGAWTIIITPGAFGNINSFLIAGGGESSLVTPYAPSQPAGFIPPDTCITNIADVPLSKTAEYRLSPAGVIPSGANVDATQLEAVAGPDQVVLEGDPVQLDGSDSSPLGEISFEWTQTGGTSVTLSDATAQMPVFASPAGPDVLTFELDVSKLGVYSEAPDSVVIIVDVDSDNDGVGDLSDACPEDPHGSIDSDGDLVCDGSDAYPNNPNESADSDGDGVGDNADQNDDSDLSPTVWINGNDSGVDNPLFEDGRTLADMVGTASVSCKEEARNHGQYVSCMAKFLNGLLKTGLITDEEKDALQAAAAQTSIGKKSKK